MEQKNPKKNLPNETISKETPLRKEKDRIAQKYGFSSFAACKDDPLLQEQITNFARQNLGYIN